MPPIRRKVPPRLERLRQLIYKHKANRYGWVPKNKPHRDQLLYLVAKGKTPRSSLPKKESHNQDHLHNQNQGILVALGFRASLFLLNM